MKHHFTSGHVLNSHVLLARPVVALLVIRFDWLGSMWGIHLSRLTSDQVADGVMEFTPTPAENRSTIALKYAIPNNLLVRVSWMSCKPWFYGTRFYQSLQEIWAFYDMYRQELIFQAGVNSCVLSSHSLSNLFVLLGYGLSFMHSLCSLEFSFELVFSVLVLLSCFDESSRYWLRLFYPLEERVSSIPARSLFTVLILIIFCR